MAMLLSTYECPTIRMCGHRRPEPEKGGGHTPPPALTRPALFAPTLLNYDLTPLGLWPPSQLLVLDLIPPHANFMTVAFMYVVNKKELVLNITYLNTIKFLAHLRNSHRGINLSRHFSVRGGR